MVGTWWCWVSIGWYWSVLGGTGSVESRTGWYWVSMERNWSIHDGTGSVRRRYWLTFSGAGSGWYMVVLCQYNLVLLSIKWNWVSTRLLCLNILKKVEIWWDVTIAGRTDEQTNKER